MCLQDSAGSVFTFMKRQKSLLEFAVPSTSSTHLADTTDSEDELSQSSKRRVSGKSITNTVQVHGAQGGTTIVINNSSGSSVVNSSPTPTESERLQKTHAENTAVVEAPSDVAASPDHPHCQPKLARFPVSLIESKQRAFNSDWYKSYN